MFIAVNKSTIVDIICKFNPNETTDQISNTFQEDRTVKYIKGNIVIPNSFDKNMVKVCVLIEFIFMKE